MHHEKIGYVETKNKYSYQTTYISQKPKTSDGTGQWLQPPKKDKNDSVCSLKSHRLANQTHSISQYNMPHLLN